MSRVGRRFATTVAAISFAAAAVAVWTADTAPRATAARSDGAAIYRSKGCAMCHSGPDSSSPFGGFPSLVDAPTWAAQRKPGMDATAYLRESVRNPSAFISPSFVDSGGPTEGMPDLSLTDAEIDAVVGYLLAAD